MCSFVNQGQIIILNYNGWQDTIECLESVLRNDYPNYQVIVVDNGSPDNSMEYIKAWAEGRQEVLTLILLSKGYTLLSCICRRGKSSQDPCLLLQNPCKCAIIKRI